MATNTYNAPYGIAVRPFAGNPFPGAPSFGTPAPPSSLSSLGFPVSNGPSIGNPTIQDFATGIMRPNRVTDQITNGRIVYNYICVAMSGDINRLADIGVGALCLARIQNLGNVHDLTMQRSKKARTTGFARPEICVDAFELTQLNNLLWHDAQKAHHGQSDFHGVKDSGSLTPQDIWRQFAVLGVVLNEPASADSRDFNIRNSNRVINFVVGGRCTSFNLWNTCMLGSSLWLVLKRKTIVRGGVRSWAWQFIPEAATHGRKPTLAQLRSDPKDGDTNNKSLDNAPIGHAVFIGTLGHTAGEVALNPSTLLVEQALFHLNAKPVVEVFLNI